MNLKLISAIGATVLLFSVAAGLTLQITLGLQWAEVLANDSPNQEEGPLRNVENCSKISLEVIEATQSSVTVQQSGGEIPVGDLRITWKYEDGKIAETTTNIGKLSGKTYAETSSEGDLNLITVEPIECDGTPSIEHTR